MKKYTITAGVGVDAQGKALDGKVVVAALDKAVKALSLCFGGCTIMQGTGAWLDPQGSTVREGVVRLESLDFGKLLEDAKLKMAKKIAHDLRNDLTQYSVVLESSEVEAMFIEA